MNRTQQSWLIDVSLAYALLRIALGLNICMHGIVRWTAGLRPLCPHGLFTLSDLYCLCSKP
jgi:hypothetical protein